MAGTQVFTNQTADGDSTVLDVVDSITIDLYGDLDQAEVLVMASADNGSNYNIQGQMERLGTMNLNRRGSYKVKLTLKDAGANTNISACIS